LTTTLPECVITKYYPLGKTTLQGLVSNKKLERSCHSTYDQEHQYQPCKRFDVQQQNIKDT